MNFIMYTLNGNYAGDGRLTHIPTKGDYFWANGDTFEVLKVIYNWQGNANQVKIVIRT